VVKLVALEKPKMEELHGDDQIEEKTV